MSGLAKGLSLARELFDDIGRSTFDGVGFTRAPFGSGEQLAHDRIRQAGHELDLLIDVDAALNLSLTLPGANPQLPSLTIGSHLDSVPSGGNYDGLAGVLAGLACLAGLRHDRETPAGDVTLLALRSEENAWFAAQHVGSRAALGRLTVEALRNARRVDTGRTLAEHMTEAGATLNNISFGQPLLDIPRVAAYLELHIEQGPVLDRQETPVGIVTGIRGNARLRSIRCHGEYGHSGVVPRELRRDAVMSMAELVTRMEDVWREVESNGQDLVLTFGQFFTDPKAHGITVVPGEVTACFDARSHSDEVLDLVMNELDANMRDIAGRRGVSITAESPLREAPIAMDARMQARLLDGCAALGIPPITLPSGAGHDAGDFAAAGIPSAMIFVRNQNGSHNPAEAMRFEDFAEGVRLMDWFVRGFHREGWYL